MSKVHRYKVVKMLSDSGNRISYDPHGPDVVMAQAYDQLKAENEALRKDAERYRWLSEKFGVTKLPCAVERMLGGEVYVADGKTSIDAVIDAAMGKGEQS